jgi:hypothetical protein
MNRRPACSLAIAGAVCALLIMVAGCAMAQTRRCEDYSLKSEYPVRLCNPPSIAGEDDDALVAYSLACRNQSSYFNYYAAMFGSEDAADNSRRAVWHLAAMSQCVMFKDHAAVTGAVSNGIYTRFQFVGNAKIPLDPQTKQQGDQVWVTGAITKAHDDLMRPLPAPEVFRPAWLSR